MMSYVIKNLPLQLSQAYHKTHCKSTFFSHLFVQLAELMSFMYIYVTCGGGHGNQPFVLNVLLLSLCMFGRG